MEQSSYFKNFIISLPFLFLVLVLFWIFGNFLNFSFSISLFLVGVGGWLFALWIRFPFILLLNKIHSKSGVILLSGPAEELTRLVIILFLVHSISAAYSLGLGWATIEIMYGIIQGFALSKLEKRTDKKALQAKKMMKNMGMDKTLSSQAPFWGIFERIFATAGHIAFSLLLFWNPFSVIVTMPFHSLANLITIKLMKRSFVLAEIFLAILFSLLFLISLYLH